MNGAQCYMNGSALLIASQKNYADGKKVKINIADTVKFEYTGADSKAYKIEIVGVNSATASEGAKLEITCNAITEANLETDGANKFKPENIAEGKEYLVDIGTLFEGTIKINGKEYKKST